jgi:uncharacterized protein YjbI with pentapeptide repeats
VGSSLVGYDVGQNVREEERRVAVETSHSPAPDPDDQSEERSSSVPLWLVVVAILALGGVVEVIIYGYLERPGWIGVADKKFWDYLVLLIVPAALALGVYWLNRRQDERDSQAQAAQRERELEVENQRAQDEALQAYLDQIGQLLLENNLRGSEKGSEVRSLARARTLTVLARLDGARKGSVVTFLYEAGLIGKPIVLDLGGADLKEAVLKEAVVVNADLSKANLSDADLGKAFLVGTDLSEAKLIKAYLWGINLSKANLRGADLKRAIMHKAQLLFTNLSEADLRKAELNYADLSNADLSGADLSRTDLSNSDLRSANLRGANLRAADLFWANLEWAQGWTEEQLTAAGSLEGATMPNGQKYEDWLKSKGSGEAGENSGPT